ncbi:MULTISPECIES: phospholipase D family protein [unclassified Paenibacillus]|uniref:phospholipase D family protein n=1 Tax=unclassified Paenibacillus TaxID=185978 RepID=UPI001AE3FF0F|nr:MULTISPECIES: phospholipase D family protein [unclassified Paenibacillus]MBP1156882.1 phosphatidylserine/phosphatidylglycerophosphate/cardiolipin synthase-like enzyme [Paenibacillus sp. PvP091]MBP1172379.1 phosphatidylserine/phosphatidylglycerophosphate/cardiolipin synthase-like enzyme [Paenibacillus sp. PvR098]MBP2438760.1 phosphatidylserine/phosphatidylglycerophosphate/cardiolipin synthase-like enzyme [Paenibacillus sp. PvP052]
MEHHPIQGPAGRGEERQTHRSRNSTTQPEKLARKQPVVHQLRLWILLLLILTIVAVIIVNTHKTLPEGIAYEGAPHQVENIEFLYDLTYPKDGATVTEQTIYNRILQAIDEAESFIVIDMFLFNGYVDQGQSFPPLSATLTDKLIARKQERPELEIVFITDEINTTYGSHPSPELQKMEAAGIATVITYLDRLRDSTPIYSGLWRTFFRWFGESGSGWLKNPLAESAPDITVRSYLKLFNVKANHRKVIATEQTAIISSANIHDASALHSNAAFAVSGGIITDVLASEQAVSNMSGGPELPSNPVREEEKSGDITVRLLTEGMVYKHVLESLAQAGTGDTVWMGMFYLADPKVVDGLLEASDRGADVRLILDPNENAFGNEKIGMPNRPVAAQLQEQSEGRIQIRWFNTADEQYHAKMTVIAGPSQTVIHSGSANLTKRNLDDLNLESNLMIEAPADSELSAEVLQYFERLWTNKDAEYTLDFNAFKDKTVPLKKWLYRLQETLGFTTY